MYLFIDASDNQVLRLATSPDAAVWQEQLLPCTAAHEILPLIERSLTGHGGISQLAGVAVLVGKGRFTATRVAVTIANTLGFSLHIPVVSWCDTAFTDLRPIFAATPPGQYVHATYSAPARIGGVSSSTPK